MRYDFSQEQKMLGDSVRRSLEALPRSTQPPKTGIATDAAGFDVLTRSFAELGLFGILVPETHGGIGLGLVEGAVAAIETGRAAAPYPAIEGIAALACIAAARPEVAAAVMEGRTVATSALRGCLSARRSGGGVRLEGTLLVPFAGSARWLAAPVDDGSGVEKVVLLDIGDAAGRIVDGVDPTYRIQSVALSREVSEADLIPARFGRMMGVLACAEMVGAADHCLGRAVAYMKDRVQFGRAIGTNQALKHIAADNYVSLECMKAATEYAAWAHDQAAADPAAEAEADEALHIAKSYCSDAGKRIALDAIQLHGGIAFTWEYGMHVQVRRITRLASSFGTAYEHRDALAGLVLARTPAPAAALAAAD